MDLQAALQEALFLWIPNTPKCPEESDALIQLVTVANGAVLDFCDGVSPLEETLEIISDCGADVDEYLADLDSSIRAFGA